MERPKVIKIKDTDCSEDQSMDAAWNNGLRQGFVYHNHILTKLADENIMADIIMAMQQVELKIDRSSNKYIQCLNIAKELSKRIKAEIKD